MHRWCFSPRCRTPPNEVRQRPRRTPAGSGPTFPTSTQETVQNLGGGMDRPRCGGRGGRDEVARGRGADRNGRRRAVARGRHRRRRSGCVLGRNAGPDAGGRQEDAGWVAAPSRSSAGGRALPWTATLPTLWGPTSAEGHAGPAADIVVRCGGGSCSPVRPLPLRRGVAPDHRAGGGDHA